MSTTVTQAVPVSQFVTIEDVPGTKLFNVIVYGADGNSEAIMQSASQRECEDVVRTIRDTLATYPGFSRTG